MSTINILFYSNNCEGSHHLIKLLENERLINFFHLICTDNNPKIPPQIKVTPTLIIRGVPTPYIAADAFAWLAKIKQWKMNMMMQKINNAQQQYMQNINNNLATNNNILGFSETEMNGMSDIFSFFAKDISKECQDPLPQSFVSYNNIGNDQIFTVPLEDGTFKVSQKGNYKINSAKQKELYTNLEQERKKQDELFRKTIDNFKSQYGGAN